MPVVQGAMALATEHMGRAVILKLQCIMYCAYVLLEKTHSLW